MGMFLRACSVLLVTLSVNFYSMAFVPTLAAADENPPPRAACESAVTSNVTTPRLPHTDQYFGVDVPDPYRWLEEMESAPVQSWIDAQNQASEAHLSQLPERSWFTNRLQSLMNYPKEGVVFKKQGRYFVYRNSGLQNQSVLYTALDAAGPWQELLNPNTMSAEGIVSLSGLGTDPAGQYIAYATSRAGLDQQEWRVRNLQTMEDLPEVLYTKFSGASWAKDGSGFYYSVYPRQADGGFDEVPSNNKVYFHRTNTPQTADELIFETPDHPDWMFQSEVTEDGKYLVITASRSTMPLNKVFIHRINEQGPGTNLLQSIGDFEAEYEFLDSSGTEFYFKTSSGAVPNGEVFSIDISGGQGAPEATVVIPTSEYVISDVLSTKHGLYVHRLVNASSQLDYYVIPQGQAAATRVAQVSLPGLGTVDSLVDNKDGTVSYSFSGYTRPSTNYRYDPATRSSQVTWQPALNFDPEQYMTEQHFVTSTDGARVPVFVIHKRGLVKDGTNPTYLYGYGGFDISLTPSFSATNMAWLERGGVYVVANLRGGGEYGDPWHRAGMRERKQNVFNDFIASAEWLIAQGYTSSRHLAVGGGSNGGLLVGAVITQRPELFRAAVPAVGVLDMLRYQYFSAGVYWTEEYGASNESLEAFRWLFAYSPYHNAGRHREYPATLILTGDHDDRVVPLHSYKFAAALQHAQRGDLPILLRVDRNAGHGAGKPLATVIAEAADKWAFVWGQLRGGQ